jgi:alpha-methylacyl-CoA racemase
MDVIDHCENGSRLTPMANPRNDPEASEVHDGMNASGPLAGLRVVEFAGLGPAPFAAMMLADMGADVVRIERPVNRQTLERGAVLRGRQLLALDLRRPNALVQAASLVAQADVLVEGYRPGVMERLGLGPQPMQSANARLVYARMTGWGQTGPRALTAGHDIDYIAITGALHAVGPEDQPVVPLNLVGDYGGGALYLVVGILAALHAARASGRGQVVDAAICDGTVSLLSLMHGLLQGQRWTDRRHSNTLDGAAPFYRSYRCSDGEFLAVGAIEPQFYAELRERAGLSDSLFDRQLDRTLWPAQTAAMAAVFAARSRSEWLRIFEGSDACVAPVLSLGDSKFEPHLVARGAFVDVGGEEQPAPAPRFSQTPSTARASIVVPEAAAILDRWARRLP